MARRGRQPGALKPRVEHLYAHLGDLIAKQHLARDMTQEALARAVGLTRTSIVNLESGRQRIPLHTLYAIAETLAVSPHSLLPSYIWKTRRWQPRIICYPTITDDGNGLPEAKA